METTRITKLSVWSREAVDFNALIGRILAGGFYLMVCQDCGIIAAGEEHLEPTESLGERRCEKCNSTRTHEASEDSLNFAFDWCYPFRRCEHCGYYFLFDDDIGKLIQPNPDLVEPGEMGCPRCEKMTR